VVSDLRDQDPTAAAEVRALGLWTLGAILLIVEEDADMAEYCRSRGVPMPRPPIRDRLAHDVDVAAPTIAALLDETTSAAADVADAVGGGALLSAMTRDERTFHAVGLDS
jgi:hypothetical protein